MDLQPLVDYFNDRFGREHRTSFRPFISEAGLVSGIYGPIRIRSLFTPIRLALNSEKIVGHKAQFSVSTYETLHLYSDDVENLLVSTRQAVDYESIINFDRLCRTVHLLNYLPVSHLQGAIFLDVDPRHILGVKKDHGAYFEDVIVRCGLETRNIVILMALNSQFAPYYQELHNGLNNYRQRGYQIALKFDVSAQHSQSFDFIARLSPNYVCLSVGELDLARDSVMLTKLHELKTLVASIGAQSILKQVDQKKSEQIGRSTGFDLIHGSYYADIPHTHTAA